MRLQVDVLERQDVGRESTQAGEGYPRESRCRLSAITHPVTMTANITTDVHSSRDSGQPMLCSSWRASAGASGVSVTPGEAAGKGSGAAAGWWPVPAPTRPAATCRSRSSRQLCCQADRTDRVVAEVAVSQSAGRDARGLRHAAEHEIAAQAAPVGIFWPGASALSE